MSFFNEVSISGLKKNRARKKLKLIEEEAREMNFDIWNEIISFFCFCHLKDQ
jgi:hypothetical protein